MVSKVPELYVGKSQNKGAYHNNKKFLKIPYTYLIFQLGHIQILGQVDTCPFKKKWHFHTKYMAKIRISEFSAKNNFCPPAMAIQAVMFKMSIISVMSIVSIMSIMSILSIMSIISIMSIMSIMSIISIMFIMSMKSIMFMMSTMIESISCNICVGVRPTALRGARLFP